MLDYLAKVVPHFNNQLGIIKAGAPEEFMPFIMSLNPIIVGEPDKGILCGIVSPNIFNPKEVITATELLWWVEPQYRATKFSINLVKQFEAEAKARGATHILMMAIERSNDMARRVYPKLGYEFIETTYIKEI